MASYLHPGVYIEEIPSGAKPIEGVSTSVAAFVGAAHRGAAGQAVLIGKFDDYVSRFGEIADELLIVGRVGVDENHLLAARVGLAGSLAGLGLVGGSALDYRRRGRRCVDAYGVRVEGDTGQVR